MLKNTSHNLTTTNKPGLILLVVYSSPDLKCCHHIIKYIFRLQAKKIPSKPLKLPNEGIQYVALIKSGKKEKHNSKNKNDQKADFIIYLFFIITFFLNIPTNYDYAEIKVNRSQDTMSRNLAIDSARLLSPTLCCLCFSQSRRVIKWIFTQL